MKTDQHSYFYGLFRGSICLAKEDHFRLAKGGHFALAKGDIFMWPKGIIFVCFIHSEVEAQISLNL